MKKKAYTTLSVLAVIMMSLSAACGDDDNDNEPFSCDVYCTRLAECGYIDQVTCFQGCMNALDQNGPACEAALIQVAHCVQEATCEYVNQCNFQSIAQNCPNGLCEDNEFQCNDGECIPEDYVCDYDCDCNDCEDENDC